MTTRYKRLRHSEDLENSGRWSQVDWEWCTQNVYRLDIIMLKPVGSPLDANPTTPNGRGVCKNGNENGLSWSG